MLDIYGTLGPRCSDPDTLRAMLEAGMSGVRLNLSHITLHDAALQIENLQRAALQCGKKAQLLIDMQGPELRIGALSRPLTLIEGDQALFGEGGVPVPALALPCLVPGQQVLLDDGKLLLKITEVSGDGSRKKRPAAASAEVIRGGTLQGRKSIALPGVRVDSPAMTETDRENLGFAKEYGVTAVMQPFVRSPEDLKTVRAALQEAGCSDIRLFAKIENTDGIRMIESLIPEADEIVIARGDLGNAVPLWDLPGVQKTIAGRCRAAGRAFMVVTQMLASMEQNAVPTRAEVSDIFNAVLDGAASVMVTGETAAGKHPAEVIRYLVNTVRSAEQYLAEHAGPRSSGGTAL